MLRKLLILVVVFPNLHLNTFNLIDILSQTESNLQAFNKLSEFDFCQIDILCNLVTTIFSQLFVFKETNISHVLYMEDSSSKMSLVVRKSVFGVSDQVRHKPGCTTTEDG